MGLEATVEELMNLKEKDHAAFLKRRREITQDYGAEDWRYLVQLWGSRHFAIPEMITAPDIDSFLGDSVYKTAGINRGSPGQLLARLIPDFGIFDNVKCRFYIDTKENHSNKLFKSFFHHERAQENAITLIHYAWEKIWRSTCHIPEQIGEKNITALLGDRIYQALGIKEGRSTELFLKAFPDFGRLDDQKCKTYLENNGISSRVKLHPIFFGGQHKDENIVALMNYAWKHIWKEKYLFPELVAESEIRNIFGRSTSRPDLYPLLDYGVLTSEKAGFYINAKDQSSRTKLCTTFFNDKNKHRVDNALYLLQYAWEKLWKNQYSIPELISHKDIVSTLGAAIYGALHLEQGNPNKLLRKAFDQYGILDDTKCKNYIDLKDKSSRKLLSYVFFNNEPKEENAISLIGYAWEHLWKEKYGFPELINEPEIRITLGRSIYPALGVGLGNTSLLVGKIFPDFGTLTEEKANFLYDAEQKVSTSMRTKLRAIFFLEPASAQHNSQLYLEAYQRANQKRLEDLTNADYQKLPPQVVALLKNKPIHVIPPKSDPDYHQIHISWTAALEGKLRSFYSQHSEHLFKDAQLIWNELGITPFAAMMKCGTLGLRAEVQFSNGSADRSVSYPFIHYDGYSTPQSMLAEAFSKSNVVHAEGFSSPVHAQGIHLQLPIVYHGIDLSHYSTAEQEIIQTMATYLHNPNEFKKAKDYRNLPCLVAPTELIDPHTLVPIRLSSIPEQLVRLYLPKSYAVDPGGIFSVVIDTPNSQIFSIYHQNVGEVI